MRNSKYIFTSTLSHRCRSPTWSPAQSWLGLGCRDTNSRPVKSCPSNRLPPDLMLHELNPCAACWLRQLYPIQKQIKSNFILTFTMWGVWDSPTVKRKCFTLFLYAVKLSQYDGGSQWLMGQNDPKITQGLILGAWLTLEVYVSLL